MNDTTGDGTVIVEPNICTVDDGNLLLDTNSQGVPGRDGKDARYYRHAQLTPEALWIVNHNFGMAAQCSVLSDGGLVVMAEVVHIDDNQLQILFPAPMTGAAICT